MYAPKPSIEALKALGTIHHSGPLNTLLEDWIKVATEALTEAQEPLQVYRIQGELSALKQFLGLVQTAPDLLKRRTQ